MKIIFCLLLCLVFIGDINSSADEQVKASSIMIHDEKYGEIPEKVCMFLTKTTGLSKTAKLNLSKVFDSYYKVKYFDAILQQEGKKFQAVRDGMVDKIKEAQSQLNQATGSDISQMEADIENQKNDVVAYDREKREELAKRRDDKVREILEEIRNKVAEYAGKNQLRAVFSDRLRKLKRDEVDITDEIISMLNKQQSESVENVTSQVGIDVGVEDKLKTLSKLLSDGLITKDEFDARKKVLLDTLTNSKN